MKVQAIQPMQLYYYKPKEKVSLVPEEPLVPSFEFQNNIPLDTLQVYSNVSFGYSNELKTLYKKGKLKIKYSFYGGKLNPKKVTLEHVIPRSKGGKGETSNYVLCNGYQNWERGNDPLEPYLDWEAVGIYLDQFKGVRVGTFNGDEYIKQVLNSINEALKTGR